MIMFSVHALFTQNNTYCFMSVLVCGCVEPCRIFIILYKHCQTINPYAEKGAFKIKGVTSLFFQKY